jgi:hypothetical protein
MNGLAGLIEQMNQAGAFTRIVNNPLSSMGVPPRRYLGATLLPERNVPENLYTEQMLRFRVLIANDAARYSPVQLKSGVISGSMLVQLGDIDIGSELSGQDYDALIKLIEQAMSAQGTAGGGVTRPTMEAMSRMIEWAEMTLNRPLLEKMEKQRWEAIVNAQVLRTGDDGFSETVVFPNPTGTRPNAAGVWSNNSYDPYTDIITGAEFLAAKGYTVTRMITSTPIRSKLSLNLLVQQRTGRISIQAGIVTGVPGRVTLADLNAQFSSDALPPVELYDLQYRTQTNSARFLASNCFILVANTGRDESIDRGDQEPLVIENTIGYQAVGRATGQATPGRMVDVQSFTKKPPRVEGEAWMSTFPVLLEPEALYVIRNIT